MIFLVENLSGLKTIVTNRPHLFPLDNNIYKINGEDFANILYLPTGPVEGLLNMHDVLMLTVDNAYNNNHVEILKQNKNKFIIATVKYLPDNTKDVIYATSYINILDNDEEYHNLLGNSPHHHYEILNYKTGKFEEVIQKEVAIERLKHYVDNFLIEYKSKVVKEFNTIEKFLEYIKVI